MLKRFESITNSGIFEDFRWEARTPDFERVNVILGSNGSGKTSLSRALDGLSLKRGGFVNASVRMCEPDNTKVRTSDKKHDDEFERVFVFSDAYVARSHDFESDTEIAAVLTLGEQSVEDQKRIAELRELISAADKALPEAKSAAGTATRALESEYTSIARGIVTNLSRAGGLYTSNANYNSGIVKRRFAGDRSTWALLPDSEFEAALATIKSDEREKLASKTFSLSVRPELTRDVEASLSASPVSEILNTLQEHPHAASWVENGQAIHAQLDVCLFCGGELTEDRKAEIERHFSDEVTLLQRNLDGLIEEVVGVQSRLTALLGDASIKAGLYDDLRLAFEVAHANAASEVSTMTDWLKALHGALVKKRENVLLRVEHAVGAAPKVDGSSIEKTIAEHNSRVDKHSTLVQESAKAVELHLLKDAEKTVEALEANAEAAREKKSGLETSIEASRAKIAALENVEGDPLPSAEVMARELSRILGRSELAFELLPSGKHYRVTRNGEPAHGLSTGERTAITLIHFLEMVKRTDARGGKPIVVIDDPVSSLDSGSAMGISTYIWSEALTKLHIEQIFLLTHNFELFRQWDIQLDGLPGKRGPTNKLGFTSNSYELTAPYRDVRGKSKRRPQLSSWPPSENARKKVRSAYHHAFLTAARAHIDLRRDSSLEKKLDALLLYPNVLRRMLETFLAFKSPESVSDFTGAMRAMTENLKEHGYLGDADALRLHLTRFTHANSHAESPESDVVVNPDEINVVLSAIFTFMHVIDRKHFEGLCKVLGIDPGDLLLAEVAGQGVPRV